MSSKNPIVELSYEFALGVIEFTELLESKKKFNMANQLFRSGTSVGANVRESQSVHSRKDFVATLVIASSEANESEYWLMLCRDSKNYPDVPEILLEQVVSIQKLISKIISSTKRNG